MNHLLLVSVGIVLGSACAGSSSQPGPRAAGVAIFLSNDHVRDVLTGRVEAASSLDGVVLALDGAPTQSLSGFGAGGNVSFELPTTGLAEAVHVLTATGKLSGSSESVEITFTVDRRPPVLARAVPTRTLFGEPITVEFSEPVLAESLVGGLRATGGDGVEWTQSEDGRVVQLRVDWGFRAPSTVRVNLSSSITDRAGNSLLSPGELVVEVIDNPDAGEWVGGYVDKGKVPTLQPRSALLDCSAFERQATGMGSMFAYRRFADGTEFSETVDLWDLRGFPLCFTVASDPDAEAFFLVLADASMHVLVGQGNAPVRLAGPPILFSSTFGFNPPLRSPNAVRAPTGQLVVTDGRPGNTQYWASEDGGWRAISGPTEREAYDVQGLYATNDGVVLATKPRNALAQSGLYQLQGAGWVLREPRIGPGEHCCAFREGFLCVKPDNQVRRWLPDGGWSIEGFLDSQGAGFLRCDAHAAMAFTYQSRREYFVWTPSESRWERSPESLGLNRLVVNRFSDGTLLFSSHRRSAKGRGP